MRRAPIKIDEQTLERHKTKSLLEKLTGIELLLAALYRQSDLFPSST